MHFFTPDGGDLRRALIRRIDGRRKGIGGARHGANGSFPLLSLLILFPLPLLWSAKWMGENKFESGRRAAKRKAHAWRDFIHSKRSLYRPICVNSTLKDENNFQRRPVRSRHNLPPSDNIFAEVKSRTRCRSRNDGVIEFFLIGDSSIPI